MFAAVATTPVFAVATYALDPAHHDGPMVANLVFHYLWVVVFSLLVPSVLLLAARKLAELAFSSTRKA